MSHFEELKLWQKSVDLAVNIYKTTLKPSFNKSDFSLKDQMRRASVSIPSNISEGDQLESDKSSVRFFRISKGSAAELITQSLIAYRIGYLSSDDANNIKKECKEILAMLDGIIRFREKE